MKNDEIKYDKNLATELAILVRHAYSLYQIYKEGGNWEDFKVEGFPFLQVFEADPFFEDAKQPFGFVAKKDEDTYIVFRGTNNYTDWYIDAKAMISPFTSFYGKAHPGFLKMFSACWDDSLNITLLHLVRSNKGTVYITGHSLGGALATLCAKEVFQAFTIKPLLYTYASPMVGDAEFVSKFNELEIPHFRVCNSEDLVPKMPIISCGAYSHVETGKIFTHDYGSVGGNHLLDHYIENL